MNTKNISTTQLAKICGVSQGTVDRALNNRKGISPKTKEKILSAAKEYGYKPNIHARCIAGGKSQLIGVVVFDVYNEYFSDILMHIEENCREKNYSTVVMFTNKDAEKEINCIKNLYDMSVDGIILCPVNSGENYENFLRSLDIPIITIGNRLNNFYYVGIDNFAAVKEAINCVIDKGYKKLIYVRPELKERNTYAQTERISAFEHICKELKVNYVISNFENAQMHIKNKQDAIICPTDIYAIRLLPITKKYNAGIIGFDNIRIIDEIDIKLDSVSYDISTAARAITDYIIDKEEEISIVSHQIINRGSL